MVKKLLLILMLTAALPAGFDYTISNTNYTVSQGSVFPDSDATYLYNYNRLRFHGDYTDGDFFATFIGDGINYLGGEYVASPSFKYIELFKSDTPFKTQTNFYDYDNGAVYARLYRFYGGYEDGKNRIVAGLQNITMGVGRIWTPTNLFNPRNTYAIEPDEVFGVAALTYTRYLGDTSHVTIMASQKADHSFRYAARYKAFLDIADIALNLVGSNETKMAGYEIEGNMADTGIELRSEGAYIKNKLKTAVGTKRTEEFFQGILGADYGFENGLSVTAEALYSSESFSYDEILLNFDSEILPNLLYSHFYTAIALSYSFNLFLDGSLLYIESFNNQNSRFVSPVITYTLNDYNTFSLGAMLQGGSNDSGFGMFSNTYYFNYRLSF
jgi:hypothetical protein